MKSVVFFFGPDGSGKTTLVKNIVRYLSNDRVRVVWFRGTHTLASVIARFISRFQLFKGSDNPYYKISIPNNLKTLWVLLEFTSFLPILIFKLVFPKVLGEKIICERSIPDFIVWVVFTLKEPGLLNTIPIKFLLSLSRSAPYLLYITASLNTLTSRRPDMDSFLIMRQLVIYEKLSSLLGAYKIDTTDKTIEESVNEILNYIGDDFFE